MDRREFLRRAAVSLAGAACVDCGLCDDACIVDGPKAIVVRSQRGWA